MSNEKENYTECWNQKGFNRENQWKVEGEKKTGKNIDLAGNSK